MSVKKTKLLFKKKKVLGNVKVAYSVYFLYKENEMHFGEIRVFKKGEYCLPENWFPRDEIGMLIRVKSIQLAKKRCQIWFDDFIKYFSNK